MKKKFIFIFTITFLFSLTLTGCSNAPKQGNKNKKNVIKQQVNIQNDLEECEKAGGKIDKINECDGSKSDWCSFGCYADLVINGICPKTATSPRVLCDKKDDLSTTSDESLNEETIDKKSKQSDALNKLKSCEDFKYIGETRIDEDLFDSIKKISPDILRISTNNYLLLDICKKNKNVLLLLINSKFPEKITSEEALTQEMEKSVFAIFDENFKNIKTYYFSINGIWMGEAVSYVCKIKDLSADYLVYKCGYGHDSGSGETWYVYDINNKKNIKIEEIYRPLDEKETTNIFRKDLLYLFSK
jgi:hypothetical protein